MEISLEILFGISFFIFGTLIGSFLNVVIYRHNTGKDLSGRSKCQSCASPLEPLQLIPILSFFIQGGVCNVCKSKISTQYPIVEFLTGTLFFLVYMTSVSIADTILGLTLVSLLIVIVVYDIKHGIIPNTFVYSFIIISFLTLFVDIQATRLMLPSIWTVATGPLLAIPIWLLWQISEGRWIGLGDAKLFLGVGWLLGLQEGITSFIVSFWIGAVVGLSFIYIQRLTRIKKLNLVSKSLTMKTEIPFAPFIILSFFIVYFFDFNLIAFITL